MKTRTLRTDWIALALVVLSGCGPEAPPVPPGPPTYEGTVLRLAAFDAPPATRAALALANEWANRHKCTIAKGEEGAWDVAVFRADRIGEFVDADSLRVVSDADLDSGDEDWSRGTVPKALLDGACRYGPERYALPYATSALVLVYRKDALESPALQALAKSEGRTLSLPETWGQLDALAKFLNGRDLDGDGRPEAGLAVALGPDEGERVGTDVYLARAGALAWHPDQYSFVFNYDSMAPRLDSPPFLEALEGLVAWKSFGPEGGDKFDANAARSAFREGKAALLIDRAERSRDWSKGEGAPSIGAAKLPGSERAYDATSREWSTQDPSGSAVVLPLGGGWFVGVSSALSGPASKAALGLAKALTGPTLASAIGRDREAPGLPARTDVLLRTAPVLGLDARSWSRAVATTLGAGKARPALRLPQASAYLDDLEHARALALAGLAPAEALRSAASDWTKLVEARGKALQRWHYGRGLNEVEVGERPAR